MGKSGTILTERYDIYGKRIVQNHISQYTILHQSDLFPQFDMKVKIVYLYMYPNVLHKDYSSFAQGYTFKMGVLPFAFWSIADYNPYNEDKKQAYENHAGKFQFLDVFFIWLSFYMFCTCMQVQT